MILRSTLLLVYLLGIVHSYGQDADFKVLISKDKLQPGDTLELMADYAVGGRALPPATFALTIEGPGNKLWQLRWPMVNGHSEAAIIFPDSIAAGAYNLFFAVQPRFLKLFGEAIHPEPPCELSALIAAGTNMKRLDVKTAPNGKFVIDNILLEGNGSIAFSHDYNIPGPPLVKLDAWLDSSFQPAATGVKQIVVNQKGAEPLSPARLRKDSVFAGGYHKLFHQYPLLQKLEQFTGLQGLPLYDSLYLPPLFTQKEAKVFDCIDDTSALSKASAFDLLKAYMPKMELLVWGDYNHAPANASAYLQKLENETMVKWNDKWYRLYMNGLYGDPSALVLPTNALASIRIYESPFFRVPQSNRTFGVIAIFERRFPFPNPFPYGNKFDITGYDADLVILSQ